MKYRQEPPFCIQIEFTEGCNLYCDFCGLRGIRNKKKKDLKFMTMKTVDNIASQIAELGWNARIEFAMHGEPTINPNFISLIEIFRYHLPNNQLMLCSNGGGLLKNTCDIIERMFEVGLNILALDEYESVCIVPKIRDKLTGFEDIEQHNYPEDNTSPHSRYSKSCKKIIYIKDISVSDSGNHSSLNNHCGNAFPLNDKAKGRRCAKVFRELSIRWNGSVAICCNDWRGLYKCGNVVKNGMLNIWNGEALSVARKFLYRGRREIVPCIGCDALSYRVGLLPDKKGKINLPRPAVKDEIKAAEFIRGRSLTVKVRREWE